MRNADPYDRVVFDTSPTGSTLRLLGLPEFLEGWIDRLMHEREKSIDLFEKAAIGNNEPRRVMDGDPVLARLQDRKEFFEFASGALEADAAFFLVLNPDQLSVNETRRAIAEMRERACRFVASSPTNSRPSRTPTRTAAGPGISETASRLRTNGYRRSERRSTRRWSRKSQPARRTERRPARRRRRRTRRRDGCRDADVRLKHRPPLCAAAHNR